MERLTTNKPVEEMNMTELARNSCYAKDGYAWYRDFETDIDAREFARDLMLNWGFFELDSDEMLSDEIFDETMMDNLQYGSKEIEGLIALFYRNLWAMADLHSRLKAYEDAEEQKLQCKPGDVVWCIEHNEYYGQLYMATCGDFVIACTEYMSFEGDFESQLEEMQFESLADEGTEVKVFHKDYVFHTKEEAEQALARMEKENG